jgi:predicted GNAT family N-acyltransferase
MEKLSADLLKEISQLESNSYPEDEKASEENLLYRLNNASDYFYGIFENKKVIGYVCGTLSKNEKLTHESMFQHQSDGETLCIHSVVIEQSKRRKGLGIQMMKEYLNYVTKHENVKRILLLCKENLISFYQQCGFEFIGESNIVHGKEIWFEMKFKI